MRVHAQSSAILRGRGISVQHRFVNRSRCRRPSEAHRGVARREAGGRADVANWIQPLVLRGADELVKRRVRIFRAEMLNMWKVRELVDKA